MPDFYSLKAATTALRILKTRNATRGDRVAAEAFTRQKGWDDRAEIVAAIKANASSIESAGVGGGQAFDFQTAASGASLMGRLPGVRRLPPKLSLLTPTARLIGTVVPEGKAVPLLATPTFARDQIALSKVATMIVATNEALRDDLVEPALAADLLATCAAALDQAFLLPSIAGSITDVVTPIDASVSTVAELDAALTAAVDALTAAGGSLATASWAMPGWLGAHLGLTRSSGQLAYPDVGASGGSLAKLPVLTYDDVDGPDSDGGQIVLVDGALIGLSEGAASLRTSQEAMIEMTTAPTGDAIAPTAAAVMRVSMFECDCTAILATLRAGWLVRRAGAVQVISGIAL